MISQKQEMTHASPAKAPKASNMDGSASNYASLSKIELDPMLMPEHDETHAPHAPEKAAAAAAAVLNANLEQKQALDAIQAFLKTRTCYDVLPFSFRVLVFDLNLLVKKSLNIMIQNNIVSATLWNSKTSKFAGILTAQDFINVIQYYYKNASYPEALSEVESLYLGILRNIERRIGAPALETTTISPNSTVHEGCCQLTKSSAKRIPIVDYDDETARELVVFVLTQFRILKFVALNCPSAYKLTIPLSQLAIGTYENVATATLDTPVMDVINAFYQRRISAVPVISDGGVVLNSYEAIDVITLIQSGSYTELELSVGEALLRRSGNYEGVQTCTENDTIAGLMEAIRNSKIHRFIVVDEIGKLRGIISLSDILGYLIHKP